MIDANKDKDCEGNNKIVELIERFFREDNTLLKSEWIKLSEK